ncbi:conserved hypothetical protein [Nitrobacter hamburgensis X14]|uniref:Transmembrane protein n=1 Tax=Nitrobacter hamburgensis (strain DSM 10229 / NCIMB 13809 / X14) TaxID=323097 RepID=Q1QNB8_NITHX|nr:hypothetical protein [Nitrobacter hamburgensis]ABE62279.1 conserved hypothetical protein [Nitrobacter hamburgensis X14]
MVGVALSRWTMSYFATAVIALLAAEGLMLAGIGYPQAPIGAPASLLLVHLIAIGWLSLLMCGALFQFAPVLVAKPLYNNALPLPTLGLLIAGLAALLLAFLQLGGTIHAPFGLFPAAAVLLGAGFGLVLWNLGRTLWAARPLPLPARFVVVGLCCLAATVLFGIVFALVRGGVTAQSQLVDVAALGLPIHVIAGLGGWLTFTAVGVSYRLLAMFMLAPEPEGRTTRGALYFGTAALAAIILGGVAAICTATNLMWAVWAAGVLGIIGLALYGGDILHLYRTRKRRVIELNSRMAGVALANLAATVALGLGLLLAGRFTDHVGVIVFLVAFAWLTGFGLAKLYKIVAFLTWLECYGPVLGKTATPRVQDLVTEPRAKKWFALYFVAVWVAAAALLFTLPWLFRLGAGAMLAATIGIGFQLLRTRRLANVAPALRLPKGARPPHLLHSSVQPS